MWIITKASWDGLVYRTSHRMTMPFLTLRDIVKKRIKGAEAMKDNREKHYNTLRKRVSISVTVIDIE